MTHYLQFLGPGEQGIVASIGIALFLRRRVDDEMSSSDLAILGKAFDAIGIGHRSVIVFERDYLKRKDYHRILMTANAGKDDLYFIFDISGTFETAHGRDYYW